MDTAKAEKLITDEIKETVKRVKEAKGRGL